LKLLIVLLTLLASCGFAKADGLEIFNAHCAICHQPNAAGIPGMYPPLADSIGSYVTLPQGRAYLVHVVSFGMTGPISVHDQLYNGMMQPWPLLTDEEVAQVLGLHDPVVVADHHDMPGCTRGTGPRAAGNARVARGEHDPGRGGSVDREAIGVLPTDFETFADYKNGKPIDPYPVDVNPRPTASPGTPTAGNWTP